MSKSFVTLRRGFSSSYIYYAM